MCENECQAQYLINYLAVLWIEELAVRFDKSQTAYLYIWKRLSETGQLLPPRNSTSGNLPCKEGCQWWKAVYAPSEWTVQATWLTNVIKPSTQSGKISLPYGLSLGGLFLLRHLLGGA
jgi:hypothetical protein